MTQRPIKFRARWLDTGRWFYSTDYGDAAFWREVEIGTVDKKTLGQFTGLHDKNGKEIWEGDILSSEYPRKDCGNCHPVVWGNGHWKVDHSIHDCCRPWRGDLAGHHISEEVIGNIYETPELLKP